MTSEEVHAQEQRLRLACLRLALADAADASADAVERARGFADFVIGQPVVGQAEEACRIGNLVREELAGDRDAIARNTRRFTEVLDQAAATLAANGQRSPVPASGSLPPERPENRA